MYCCAALAVFYLTEESQDQTRDATEDTSGHKVSRLIILIISLPPKGLESAFNLSDRHLGQSRDGEGVQTHYFYAVGAGMLAERGKGCK